ncbi:hypothetical protein VTO42DRAFT_3124 [Malbranchea cinnamomea]
MHYRCTVTLQSKGPGLGDFLPVRRVYLSDTVPIRAIAQFLHWQRTNAEESIVDLRLVGDDHGRNLDSPGEGLLLHDEQGSRKRAGPGQAVICPNTYSAYRKCSDERWRRH